MERDSRELPGVLETFYIFEWVWVKGIHISFIFYYSIYLRSVHFTVYKLYLNLKTFKNLRMDIKFNCEARETIGKRVT